MKKPQTFDCRKIPLRRLENLTHLLQSQREYRQNDPMQLRVLIAVNPYEPVAQTEKQALSVRKVVLVISLGALYTLTGLIVPLLAYLPIRYPGLSDKESGPAY